jgi:ferritin-like metal-binding protein YciE
MASQKTKQLTKHIDESIAMEESVLRLLDSMLKTTQDPAFKRALEKHKETTRQHVERLQERLRAHGARRSVVRQAGGKFAGGAKTVADVARREKAGRNARDGFATEQMEVAAYELLERIARLAGDDQTAEVARQNRTEDEAMAAVIAKNWDKVAEQSLSGNGQSGGQQGTGIGKRAKGIAGVFRNPVVIGIGSVVGGIVLGRRLQGGGQAASGEESLEALPKAELQARAEQAGVEVKRSMTKQQLIDAIESGGKQPQRAPSSPIEVQKFLEGVGYPVSRDTLVKEATRQGAGERVRTSLSQLPRKRFQSPSEVSEALAQK